MDLDKLRAAWPKAIYVVVTEAPDGQQIVLAHGRSVSILRVSMLKSNEERKWQIVQLRQIPASTLARKRGRIKTLAEMRAENEAEERERIAALAKRNE
jgi:hypothetical protein